MNLKKKIKEVEEKTALNVKWRDDDQPTLDFVRLNMYVPTCKSEKVVTSMEGNVDVSMKFWSD